MSGYQKVTSALGSATRAGFEALCGALLSPFLADLTHSAPMRDADRGGVDWYVLSEDQAEYDLCFQCKGFEHEVGEDQVEQCLASISAFRRHGRTTKRYFLVLNRAVRTREHREPLETALAKLVADGNAEEATLLAPRDFIEFLVELAEDLISSATLIRYQHLAEVYKNAMEWRFYLPDVPFHDEALPDANLTNPLHCLHRMLINNLASALTQGGQRPATAQRIFIVSEFGYGKTSFLLSLFESLRTSMLRPFYLPVSQFSRQAFANEKTLIADILGSLLDTRVYECEYVELVLRETLVRQLRADGSNAVLLFDGLDEHPLCYTDQGLARVFGCLATLRIPCLFTVRKELWDERQGNVHLAVRPFRPQVSAYLFDEWMLPQLDSYMTQTEAAVDTTTSPTWAEFAAIIRSGAYLSHFGDIPRRPLFLRMLVDDALAGIVTENDLGALYENYVRRKIARDRENLVGSFDAGRPLSAGDADHYALVETIMDVLTEVAGTMCTLEASRTILQASVSERVVRDLIDAQVGKVGTLVEFINHSVLMPNGPRANANMKLRFAHRSFQEWFAARWFRAHPHALASWPDRLPLGVRRFLGDGSARTGHLPLHDEAS